MPCPECGSPRVRTEANGEVVCQACGLVLEERQATAPPEGPAPHLGTPRRTRGKGRPHSDLNASERRWIDAAQQVRRTGREIQCPPDVAEEAARLVKRAQNARLTQGRDLRAIAAAALLASCRRMYLARTEEQVAEVAGIEVRELRSAYRALTRGLELSIPKLDAHTHMARVASRLGVPTAVESEARRILSPICGTKRAAGRSPLGWAAAALVLAARRQGVALSANQASRAAGVSTSTVGLRLADLEALDDV